MKINKKTIEKDLEYLRQISKEIDLTNNKYKEIVNLLHEYCESSERVLAIASIQLGIPYRLIYVKKTDLDRLYDDYNESKVLINPVVKKRIGLTRYWETCASCLNYMGLVERPYKLEIEYYDIDLNKHTETFTGFAATVLSHELDHLDGILHIDKSLEIYEMEPEERKKFRETHDYEIIRKTGEFKESTNKNKKLNKKLFTK